MTFGEIQTNKHYSEIYSELLSFVGEHFKNIESGLQGDAYIWIELGNEKVSIDTFNSMQFQIKSNKSDGVLLEKVLLKLKEKYQIDLYKEPYED